MTEPDDNTKGVEGLAQQLALCRGGRRRRRPAVAAAPPWIGAAGV